MMAMDLDRAELQVADSPFLTSTDDYTSAISWPEATANCSGTGNVQVRLTQAVMCV